MQANGVVENGTTNTTGEIAVNGLGGNNLLSGKKRENGVCDGMELRGVARRVPGEVLPRKMKPRQQLSAKDLDIIRLIGQHLREMGFGNTLNSLVDESGCHLEHPKAATFRAHVIAGEWDEATAALENLVPLLSDSSHIEKMRLLLLQEKYLELLESGREMEALQCLRHELAPVPLHHSDKQLQRLTSYMMYSDKEMLRKAAQWPGLGGGAREKLMDELQGFMPSSVMLPPKRLQQLLNQAVQLQVERCPFHYLDADTSDYSLLNDHICSRSSFPCETVKVLKDHPEEVWFVKFSHNGLMLASGSKDGLIVVWDTTTPRPVRRFSRKIQGEGVAVMSWSPDDSNLIVCGREENSDAMIISAATGEVKCRVTNSSDDNFVCCAWHRDGTKFYVGGTRGHFLECSATDGSVASSWEGIRVQAIATHPNSDDVYAADTHYRIRRYNFSEKSSSTLVQEHHSIMSFTLSQDGRHALLNIASQGIHLWDLHDKCLLRRYHGVTQTVYAIHSCYGGVKQSFVASGSEDNHIYIWHHRRETPVVILKGHCRPVNCVDWNTRHRSMLASASDDGTIRIWGTEEEMKAEQKYQEEVDRKEKEREPAVTVSSSSADGGETSVGMEVQQSLATVLSSSEDNTADSRSSEAEATETSSSSLSLSSERLAMSGIMSLSSRIQPRSIGGSAVVLDTVEGRSGSSGGQAVSSWSLPSLEEVASQVHYSSLDFGGSARVLVGGSEGSNLSRRVGEAEGGGGGGTHRPSQTRASLVAAQEHSMEQDSSLLSQDSSNGSSSQVDELNEEEDDEEDEEEEVEEEMEARLPVILVPDNPILTPDNTILAYRTEGQTPRPAQDASQTAERAVSSPTPLDIPSSASATPLSLSGPAPSAVTGMISDPGSSGGSDRDSSSAQNRSRRNRDRDAAEQGTAERGSSSTV